MLRHFNQDQAGRWTIPIGLAISRGRMLAPRGPQIGPIRCSDNPTQHSRNNSVPTIGLAMSLFVRFTLASLLVAMALFAPRQTFAQSGDAKSSDKPPVAQPGDAAKEA